MLRAWPLVGLLAAAGRAGDSHEAAHLAPPETRVAQALIKNPGNPDLANSLIEKQLVSGAAEGGAEGFYKRVKESFRAAESGGGKKGDPGAPLPSAAARTFAEAEPNSPYLQGELGRSLYAEGDRQAALMSFGRAIEFGSRDPDDYAGHALAALELGSPEQARESARRALALSPGHPVATAVLELSEDRVGALKGGAPAAGDASAPRVVSSVPGAIRAQERGDFSELLIKKGRVALTEHGDGARAARLASTALRVKPGSVDALLLRAWANNLLPGRAEAARADAEAVLRAKPKEAFGRLMRSWALSRAGRHREALADAEAAGALLKDEKGRVLLSMLRALALLGLGDRERAAGELRALAEANPAFSAAAERVLAAPGAAAAIQLLESELLARAFRPAEPEAPAGGGPRWVAWAVAAAGGAGLALLIALRWRGRTEQTPTPEAGAAPLAEGSVVGRQYALTRRIGAGGMGVVYEGRDLGLDRRVAVKRMREELRASPELRARFAAEARTVAKLRHPGIVEIYSVLEEGDEIFMVLEFVAGRTLAELLAERGRLPYAEAARMLGAACAAVEYAHRKGVVHRDLKPANIMLGESGELKVMDFGIAREARDIVFRSTRTNTPVGTPAYMAPEQERGEVCRESDVFALGACFYEMLSGELPFAGVHAGMLLNKAAGRRVPIRGRVPDLPAGIEELFDRALAPEPAKRCRSPEELARLAAALA